MTDDETATNACLISLVLGLIMGGLIVGQWVGQQWRREAVGKGFAEYNQATGDWQWKTNCLERK